MYITGINNIFKILKLKFVKDSTFVFISYIILALSGIIINIIIGNAYGPEGLGIFNQAMSLFMIFSLITVFGLNTSVVKYVSEYKDNKMSIKEIFSTASIISLFFSILVVSIIFSVTQINSVFFLNNEVTKSIKILCFCLPIFTQNKINFALVNALRHMNTYSIVQSLRWIMIVCSIGCLILLKKDIYAIFIFMFFIELLILLFFLVNYFSYFTCKFKNKFWFQNNLIFGSKSVFMGFLSESNGKIDIFFISFFLSNYYVGIYSLASSIAQGLLTFASVVQLNINPIVSELWIKKDFLKLQKYTDKISKFMIYIIIFGFLMISMGFPVFVDLFMTNNIYEKSIPVFYILLVGIFLPAIYDFSGGYLTMANFLNRVLINVIIKIILNIVFCFIFIKYFGLYGAAISSSLIYICSVLLTNYYVHKLMFVKIINFYK